MRNMILIADKNFHLDELAKRLSKEEFHAVLIDEKLSIQDTASQQFILVEHDDTLSLDYEEDELDILKLRIPNPSYYLITFKDIELLKRILTITLNRADILLDNDLGLIQTGEEFVSTLDQRPNWDWVNDLPREPRT